MFTADFLYGTIVVCTVGAYLYLFVNQRFDLAFNPKRGVISGDVPPVGDPSLIGPTGVKGANGSIVVMSEVDRSAWEASLRKRVETRNFWMGILAKYILPVFVTGVGVYAFTVNRESMVMVTIIVGVILLLRPDKIVNPVGFVAAGDPNAKRTEEKVKREDPDNASMIGTATYVFIAISIGLLWWAWHLYKKQHSATFRGVYDTLWRTYKSTINAALNEPIDTDVDEDSSTSPRLELLMATAMGGLLLIMFFNQPNRTDNGTTESTTDEVN